MKKIKEDNSQLQIKLEEMIADGKLTKENIRKGQALIETLQTEKEKNSKTIQQLEDAKEDLEKSNTELGNVLASQESLKKRIGEKYLKYKNRRKPTDSSAAPEGSSPKLKENNSSTPTPTPTPNRIPPPRPLLPRNQKRRRGPLNPNPKRCPPIIL